MTTTTARMAPVARKSILTVHVIAGVALVGITGTVMILSLMAAGAASSTEAHALYRSAQVVALAMAIPFSLTSLATGIVLGLRTPWGVFRYRWVTAKLALQLGIILMGALVVGPTVEDLVQDAAAGRPLGSGRWQLAIAGGVNLLFAITAVGLSVFKPGGRLRRSPARA
jgi:hypothetical protein